MTVRQSLARIEGGAEHPFQVTPGITRAGSLSLSLLVVNTAWLTATESDRSVSVLAVVNSRRTYLPLR